MMFIFHKKHNVTWIAIENYNFLKAELNEKHLEIAVPYALKAKNMP